MIGVRLADGSFYPVLEEGVPKTKKLTLTTARDGQETAHIVLVRGRPGDSAKDLTFIRELFLSGLESVPAGTPDIELTLRLDKDSNLHAELSAPRLAQDWDYEAPRRTAGRLKKKRRGKNSGDFRVTLKYWQSAVPRDMTDEELAASGVYIRPNAVSLTAFVLLGLFICAVLAFVFFEVFRAPPQAPLGMIPVLPVQAFFFPCRAGPGLFRRLSARARALVLAALGTLCASCGADPPGELPMPAAELFATIREGNPEVLRSLDLASLDLEACVRRQPGALYYLACGLQDMNFTREAGVLLKTTFLHDSDPWRREAGRELAESLRGDDRPEDALAVALRYRELYPEDFRAQLIMMKALLVTGGYKELLACAEEFYSSASPGPPPEALARALFYRAQAEARLDHPRFAETVRVLFRSYPASAPHREAWDGLIEADKNSENLFSEEELAFFEAKVRLSGGDWKSAFAAYKNQSLRFADDPAFLREYAEILQRVRGWKEGIKELEDILPGVSRDARVICQEYLGRFYRLGGEYARSLVFFRGALEGLGARENIFPVRPGKETQKDRILWYLLAGALKISPDRMMRALPEYFPSLGDPAYFSDLFESLASGLVRVRGWKPLASLYLRLREAGWERESARYAFLLASAIRAGLYAPPQGQLPGEDELFEYALAHGQTYYRILAGLILKKDLSGEAGPLEFFLVSSAPRGPGAGEYFQAAAFENVRAAGSEDKLVEGFLDFGLGGRAVRAAQCLEHSLASETILRVAENEAAAGRYIDTLRLLQRASHRPGVVSGRRMLEALYPQAYFKEMSQVIATANLPPEVFYGLVREESYFDAAIGSHAGAVGLAQLMPETAREVAEKLKIPSPELTDPFTNLRIGAFYLRAQWERFGDGLSALAAYNAGTGRARQWRRQHRGLPEVLFVEALSLSETREYIRKVLVSAVHYGYLYHQKNPRETVRGIFKDFS
jgi:soluble lytic murein transglycosylase-like protein